METIYNSCWHYRTCPVGYTGAVANNKKEKWEVPLKKAEKRTA
jgi:hypothetical protein